MRSRVGFAAATEQNEEQIARIPGALAVDRSSMVLGLIERVALEPQADVEKLDRVMAMYERMKAKEAELAYNAAKGWILKKLVGIKFLKNKPALCEIEQGKPQKGTYEAFKYATLEEVDKTLRQHLFE